MPEFTIDRTRDSDGSKLRSEFTYERMGAARSLLAHLVCYALEDRSPWFVFAFAAACALGSVYGFLQGAWPFGVLEAIWSIVALMRWRHKAQVSAESGRG
jgi:hypothetical protein